MSRPVTLPPSAAWTSRPCKSLTPVCASFNAKNEVVAIKMMERNSRTASNVDRELRTFAEVTALAEKHDGEKRIIRVREVIRQGGDNSSAMPFEEISVIIEPMMPKTVGMLIGSRSMGSSQGMSINAARVFRDTLLAVKVLHDNDWLHGDLKPPNIGLIGTPLLPVILDTGGAVHLEVGSALKPTPGSGGTLNCLAPERELQPYDQSVDILSLGCVGYELTYGCNTLEGTIRRQRNYGWIMMWMLFLNRGHGYLGRSTSSGLLEYRQGLPFVGILMWGLMLFVKGNAQPRRCGCRQLNGEIESRNWETVKPGYLQATEALTSMQ